MTKVLLTFKSIFGGPPVIGTRPRRHWEVRFCATAFWYRITVSIWERDKNLDQVQQVDGR